MALNSHGSVLRHYSRCFSQKPRSSSLCSQLRFFTASANGAQDVQQASPSNAPIDPALAYDRYQEKRLKKEGRFPVGSKRRRVALNTSSGIPFEQLPFQCFQEARKVLAEDRKEKVDMIATQRQRISRLIEQDPTISGGEREKQNRLTSMRRTLEELKILADINDPMVKKKFEDGMGDMNKPVYRHLADTKWREYRRPLVLQRVTQMNVLPDVLPSFDPVASVELAFKGRKVQPGDFVQSKKSEPAPTLQVQVFDQGPRMMTVVFVDSDIPDLETDSFGTRCHGIFSNIEVTPTNGSMELGELAEENTILPWLPPTAQKGAPYHRLSVFVFQQPEGLRLDVQKLKETTWRDNFVLRSFVGHTRLQPVGITMFRSQWDETTAEVMQRHNIPGADIEFQRKSPEKLPYKKKDGKRYR